MAYATTPPTRRLRASSSTVSAEPEPPPHAAVVPDAPPTRAEFELLAAQVRRLAAQIAHGRA